VRRRRRRGQGLVVLVNDGLVDVDQRGVPRAAAPRCREMHLSTHRAEAGPAPPRGARPSATLPAPLRMALRPRPSSRPPPGRGSSISPSVSTRRCFRTSSCSSPSRRAAGPDLVIILVLDGAGWHTELGLAVPEGIPLIGLDRRARMARGFPRRPPRLGFLKRRLLLDRRRPHVARPWVLQRPRSPAAPPSRVARRPAQAQARPP
jgi:hypothetical protein